MSLLFTVQVPNRPVEHLETVVGGPRYARLRATAAEFRRRLGGRRIWNVNSTAVGGGVAEMLQALVGYVRDLDIPIEWTVIGVDWDDEITHGACQFLRPYLAAARGYVFSRSRYVPSWVPERSTSIIPPSIDPFSPKNQELDRRTVRGILTTIGVLDGHAPDRA